MWTTACCVLPVMWRSAIPCMGRVFDSITTQHILGLVSQLRPDMVKELKTNGSGKLPPALQKRKTKHLTASAHEAFAIIRTTAKDNTEGCRE